MNLNFLKLTTSAVLAGTIAPVTMAQETEELSPQSAAVSSSNSKYSIFAGAIDDVNVSGLGVGYSLPVGDAVGLQIDGVAGNADEALFYGVAAHLFWRDPNIGLFGVYASQLNWDERPHSNQNDISITKIGFETHYYSDRWSLENLALFEDNGQRNGYYNTTALGYYINPNSRVDLSLTYDVDGRSIWSLSGERLFDNSAYSMSYSVGLDEDDRASAFLGFTFYRSQNQSTLIDRHRKDDPAIYLPDDLISLPVDLFNAGVESYPDCGNLCDGNT